MSSGRRPASTAAWRSWREASRAASGVRAPMKMPSACRPAKRSPRGEVPAWNSTGVRWGEGALMWMRSEEHTSELQSPCNLVCRLLLEKKKKKQVKLDNSSNSHVIEMKSNNVLYLVYC